MSVMTLLSELHFATDKAEFADAGGIHDLVHDLIREILTDEGSDADQEHEAIGYKA